MVDGAFLRCTSLDCSARSVHALIYWCRSLELVGVGEKRAELLTESGLVDSIPDLYSLTLDDLMGLERMAEKSASNVLAEIDASRSMSLSKFLSALGLPRIGPEIAAVVAAYKGMNAAGGPKGVGDAVNESVVITFVLLFIVNFVISAIYLQVVPPKTG